MKRKIFLALLSLSAIVEVAFALPLTRPTITTNPREMVVEQNVPFVVIATFTNADKLFVYRGGMTYGSIYEFILPEHKKNIPDITYAEYTDRLFEGETFLELWFVVQSIDDEESDFCITTCYAN